MLRQIHRYLSLTLAAVWAIQAATGALMVFHWELDDAGVAGEHQPFDERAVGSAVTRVQHQHPDATVVALYATAGQADRFDLYLEDRAGRTDIVRIDGAGRTLVERPLDHDYAQAGFIQAAIVVHQNLFAGDRGRTFLGFSALLLLTNIGVGLKLAWPRRHEWRRALAPPAVRGRAAALFAWHRATGLWLALPALVLVTAGMLLAFEDPLQSWLGAGELPAVLSHPAQDAATLPPRTTLDPGAALTIGLARFPGALLSSLRMPAEGAPWYRVRLRQAGEPARVYGRTAVYVSPVDGRILAVDDALTVPAKERFMNLLFPVHTGEVLGLPGRLLALTLSLWMLSMLTLGISLWDARRTPRRPAAVGS